MRKKTLIMLSIVILLFGSLAVVWWQTGLQNKAPNDNKMQIANPWVDATNEEASILLGGKMYEITTLDKSYEQYAMMITTNEAIEKTGIKPTAWLLSLIHI